MKVTEENNRIRIRIRATDRRIRIHIKTGVKAVPACCCRWWAWGWISSWRICRALRSPCSLVPGCKQISTGQCCGSGSGAFLTPGSRIPNPYFWELSDNFLDKKFYNSLKICPNFFLQHFKTKIIFNFCEICGYIKSYENKFFFTPLFWCCFWIWDPRSGMGKIRIRDPG